LTELEKGFVSLLIVSILLMLSIEFANEQLALHQKRRQSDQSSNCRQLCLLLNLVLNEIKNHIKYLPENRSLAV
jgi:hypothetical protein